MSKYLFLERFNNYFNRKVIRYDNVEDYEANSKSFVLQDGPFSFKPNDNVSTEIIANSVGMSPDYFIELNDSGEINSRWFVIETIRTREIQWRYILKRDVIADNVEALMTAPVFVQKGIVADDNPLILNGEGMNFNQIKTEETLLKDKTNTSWLVGYIAKNKGGSDINIQVPASEIKNYVSLKDIADDLGTTEAVMSGLLNFDGMNTNPTRFITRFLITYTLKEGISYSEMAHWYKTNWSLSSRDSNLTSSTSNYLFDSTFGKRTVDDFDSYIYANRDLINAQILTLLDQEYYFTNAESLPKLKKYAGAIVRYLGKYYKLRIVESGNNNVYNQRNFSYTSFSSLEEVARDTANSSTFTTLNSNGRYGYLYSYAKRVYIQMEEISDSEAIPVADAKISTNRITTQEQQFDLICAPAGDMQLVYDAAGTPTQFKTNGDIARKIFSELAIQEDANVYDVQLLPYCPVPYLENGSQIEGTEGENFDYITTTGPEYVFTEKNVEADSDSIVFNTVGNIKNVTSIYSGMQVESGSPAVIDSYSYEILSGDFSSIILSPNPITINDSTGSMQISYAVPRTVSDAEAVKVKFSINYHYGNITKVVNVIFYCKDASFQQQLDYQLELKDSMKIDSQCDMYRLVSPNYQGTFEFNVAKNGGSVNFFTAYCTYKPYTPFIKVCPELNFVYGMDYNDNRGLICAGDFSLPRVSSAWQSYQLNNKNYQNIFNREIQNLDLMQSIEARQQYITGGIGIGMDSLKGAMAGGMASGSPWGALAGGIIGAGASAVGYATDIDIMAKQHQEAKSFAIDKYNYQLGNIKALPYTLTKVGAFDISSKIFPVLEYYTCSEEEKQALRNKIKYESMTIMAIGLFVDYYKAFDEPKYFKGELIRCDDIADDSHVADAIYAELLKGVYM